MYQNLHFVGLRGELLSSVLLSFWALNSTWFLFTALVSFGDRFPSEEL